MESYEIQALRDVVKIGGEDVLEKLEEKFIEIRVEGKRKSPASTMFTETPENFLLHITQRRNQDDNY